MIYTLMSEDTDCMSHNIMNVFFFGAFPVALLSLKWQITGFFISSLSKSESFNRENLEPSSPFFCTWFTILSSIPICRKNVDMSSAVKSCRFPSFGISMSCSGMNFCFAENENKTYSIIDVFVHSVSYPESFLSSQEPFNIAERWYF